MKPDKLKRYRFATEAQWNACLFVQANRAAKGVGPFAPYAPFGERHDTQGAHAPVVTRTGEWLWFDNQCAVYRLSPDDEKPERSAAPAALTHARRVVATASGLWMSSDDGQSLQCYETETLTRLVTVDFPGAHVADLARGEGDSVFALMNRQGVWQAARIDRRGQVIGTVTFEGVAHARAFVYLRRSQRFVVLAGEKHAQLYWFSLAGGSALQRLAVAALHPCFTAHVLGSDGRDQVFLSGAEGEEFYVTVLDAEGNSLGEILLEAEATGLTATREKLVVTDRRGLLQFQPASAVPEGTAPVQCRLLTPVLFSPDREDQRRWLRAEVQARLPEGSTLEIAYLATDDDAQRNRLNAIATNAALTASQRVVQLLSEPDLLRGQTVFYGDRTQDAKTFAAKLFDVQARYLLVCVTLTATASATLPQMSELTVSYPGRTLMEDLPAIYQRE
ncbi:MAG: hypothetical protein HOP19_17795, partial [Acidobacteria bacterium]|nr:hypothetical protein [Acidobacteriota bacterium]